MSQEHQNRLKSASSPYLQQHAKNPVDWYEWGPEALEKAKKEDKPLIISIGYSACHWCHVMEAESFMDEEVADYMNEHFVCIKVDREERPDIDQIYIEASQLLNESAGWPLNAFALPDGKPFWVGVYFPKENWLSVLEQLHGAYVNENEKVTKQADLLTEGVNTERLVNLETTAASDFSQNDYSELWSFWNDKIDLEKGGFLSKQKFPMSKGWEFLLQYQSLTDNNLVLETVKTTLKAMAFGGIYDQIGGGFSRYATDQNWFAPHFEKMLYDNAQLVSLYAQAYRETKDPLYETIIKETLNFVRREMTSKDGGFYSALNADSEGEEGKFYVWTATEIEEVLDPEQAELFKAYYNVIPVGNWENGKNILYRSRTDEEFGELIEMKPSMVEFKIHALKKKMLKHRNKRVRPSRDDKMLTSWNALMIKGFVEAYRSLQEDWYLQAALTNANFLLKNVKAEDGGLYRNYKDEKASIPGFLEDYAYLTEAFVKLYQVTFEIKWLHEAKELTNYVLEHFLDEESGMFYYTSDQSEELVARKMEFMDNELPSSNGVMAKVLYELGMYFDDEKYLEQSEKMLMKIKPLLSKGAPYFGKWAQLLGVMTFPTYEVAILGEQAHEKAMELQKEYLPNALLMGGQEENLDLLKSKLIPNKTMIYVCQNKTCQQPVEEVSEALKQMGLVI